MICIWLIAGLVVWAAKTTAPNAESVLRWLRTQDSGAGTPAHAELARELPLRLSRLGWAERRRVLASDYFNRAVHSLDRAELDRFLTVAIPEGLCTLLTSACQAPEDRRQAFVRAGLEQIRALPARDGLPVDRALLRRLVQRGIAMFEDAARAEDRVAMLPFIQQFSRGLEWL